MSSLDPKFSGEIFRKDRPLILASNRLSAVLRPVRLRYDSSGYEAGRVLARNSGDGFYQKYDNNTGSSGIDTAVAVLMDDHGVEDFDSAATAQGCIATAVFGGCLLFKDNLVGLDSGAITDLAARIIVDASAVNLLAVPI